MPDANLKRKGFFLATTISTKSPNRFFLLIVGLSQLAFTSYASAQVVSDSALQQCIDKATEKSGVSAANELTELKCHNKGVETLNGIEQLINLENLSLFGNNIKRAELSELTNLQQLNIAKNELESIDIKGLDKLEMLFLFKNDLSTVDFTGVSSLKKMRLMQNKLVNLDISPLKNVEEIYLWDNQLEDLQITGLDKLRFLDVKQNPMPDELYDFYDEQTGMTISHDGNADDWK
jgi:Leucine-rich repeat (LRR) protein